MTTRAALYLRQSTHREESISLELQEAACRRHCEERGYTVVMVESDPGISGRTFNRPAVKRVMEAVEARQVDVVVLWKWSRMSRSRRDWAIAADRVDVAGGRIESATEDIDVSTSHGRLARGMMVEFAAFESERIGDQWKETHARRISNGLPTNGRPRFGYEYTNGHYTPHPETGPVLAELYRRYIAGESMYALVKVLNDRGITTTPGYGRSGGAWSQRSLRRTMDAGFGAGLLHHKGEHLPGAHEPVIDPGEWETYKAIRDRRRVERGSERSTYLMSGLVWCQCGEKMVAGGTNNRGVPKWRCRGSFEKRSHPGGQVSMRVVEDAVREWLTRFEVDAARAAELAAKTDHQRRASESDAARMRDAITRTEQALTRLTVSLADGLLTIESYRAAATELEERKAGLLSSLSEVESERHIQPPSIDTIRALLRDWDILQVSSRRAMLKQTIRRVTVTAGRPKSTVEITPAWEPRMDGQ